MGRVVHVDRADHHDSPHIMSVFSGRIVKLFTDREEFSNPAGEDRHDVRTSNPRLCDRGGLFKYSSPRQAPSSTPWSGITSTW